MGQEAGPTLRTARLILRRWRDGDRAPFAALNADPVVMEHLVSTLTREQSDAFVDRIESEFEDAGYGLWAVEVVGPGKVDRAERAPFIGFVGLHRVPFAAHFSPSPRDAPAVEVGWRLARAYWGNGYASEAARAAIEFGLDVVGLDEVVSFTSPDNRRSRRVMEQVGMTRDPRDDFEHPNVPAGHRLRRSVLYRIASVHRA